MLAGWHSTWQTGRLGRPSGQGSAGRASAGNSLQLRAELSGRAGSSSGGSGGEGESRRPHGSGRGGGAGRRRKARQPGMFEIQDISPPPRSLGIHALPPSTHNGDLIEVEGSAYVVQSVVLQYKLVRGRYKRDHCRLEVQGTGRMLANLFLEELYQKEGPTGSDGHSGPSAGGGGNGGSSGGGSGGSGGSGDSR